LKPFSDSKGCPIYPGDLIRSFHFTGRRGKKYFLYHVVVSKEGRLWLIPTSHLEPTKIPGGGDCLLSQEFLSATQAEIISGYGPGDCLYFEDRKLCLK
jgi:hypothetical protein